MGSERLQPPPDIAVEIENLRRRRQPVRADPAAAVPEEEKSAARIACEKKGDLWAKAGNSSAHTCVKRTRDNGKRCTRGTQCEGLCLARSGTCAPFTPLFGCNEILQDDGRRVTLCLD